MKSTRKILKVLIVDDSRIFRSAVQEGLAHENDIEVIGSVWNGIKALEFIKSNPPDIVTLDIEMPDMDGIETLEAIQKINATQSADKQIGVIMLSSHTQKGADITVRALQMGAFDFIPKPEGRELRKNIENLCLQLIIKIRQFGAKYHPFAASKGHSIKSSSKPVARAGKLLTTTTVEAIVIGVSTGGPRALADILPSLCENLDVPVFIVQHMPPTFTKSLAKSLNIKCDYTIIEGKHEDIVRKKYAYIAPGGRHMVLEKNSKNKNVKTIINDRPPQKGCRPSVDVLFQSVASVYGKNTIGIILTGMGVDGTEGARILKKKDAFIIAQDEETSVVWGMPGSAVAAGYVDKICPLRKIPAAISSMLKK
jgi:two-component system chemotaxis response regulator CheB